MTSERCMSLEKTSVSMSLNNLSNFLAQKQLIQFETPKPKCKKNKGYFSKMI